MKQGSVGIVASNPDPDQSRSKRLICYIIEIRVCALGLKAPICMGMKWMVMELPGKQAQALMNFYRG